MHRSLASPRGAAIDADAVLAGLRAWGAELGFSQIGVTGVDLAHAEPGLQAWLDAGYAGAMGYMAAHGLKRARPAELVPGTVSVITARLDYLPRDTPTDWQTVQWRRTLQGAQPVVSLYAQGRDYHKVVRARLQQLAERLQEQVGAYGWRVFTDSAPVLECELAVASGQGWRGKHSLVLDRAGGSMFFLGEILTDLPLPPTPAVQAHCGSCNACQTACPTGAIVADGVVDARRCISYLTIEHPGPIPLEWRAAIGVRVYGCDDCQLACPWNKYATPSVLADFDARPQWQADALTWWRWSEADFLHHTEGSPIRRIGFERWQRNLAVASGNALQRLSGDAAAALRAALMQARERATPLVREHLEWALGR